MLAEGQWIQGRLLKWPLRSHLLQANPFVQTLTWRCAGQLCLSAKSSLGVPWVHLTTQERCEQKRALPPSQHRKQSQTAGGRHKWDYLEARNITWDVNKKHFQLTSLWNHYKRNTFRLLLSHILSWVPLQALATYEAQSYFLPNFQVPVKLLWWLPFKTSCVQPPQLLHCCCLFKQRFAAVPLDHLTDDCWACKRRERRGNTAAFKKPQRQCREPSPRAK